MSNGAWANFEASRRQRGGSAASAASAASNGTNGDAYHQFEIRQGLEDHYSIPVQEEAKVAQYVQNIHREMYPLGDARPTNWINAIVGTYKRVRHKRVLEFRKARGGAQRTPPGQLTAARRAERKKEYQSAMKGLRMHIVVGCILRCLLVQDNVGLPVRILLRYMNNAMHHSSAKGDKTPITLEQFERYRYDTKTKGIKDALMHEVPRCYNRQEPSSLVSFTGFSILRLSRPDVQRAIRLSRNITREFPDTTPAGDIAIGALFSVMVSLGQEDHPSVQHLALSKTRLKSLYKVFKESNAPAVARDLQTSRSPSSLFRAPQAARASLK